MLLPVLFLQVGADWGCCYLGPSDFCHFKRRSSCRQRLCIAGCCWPGLSFNQEPNWYRICSLPLFSWFPFTVEHDSTAMYSTSMMFSWLSVVVARSAMAQKEQTLEHLCPPAKVHPTLRRWTWGRITWRVAFLNQAWSWPRRRPLPDAWSHSFWEMTNS